MEVGLFDGGKDGTYNGVSFVETSKIFTSQNPSEGVYLDELQKDVHISIFISHSTIGFSSSNHPSSPCLVFADLSTCW